MVTHLAKELDTYQKLLPGLMVEEGKYALIFGTELIGVFTDYEEALKAGYDKAKLEPFLVKKISGTETIAYFSRDIDSACHTSPSS
ncbi:MAG TPA: hypothetical protein VII24_05280 [Pseudolabrys sp.]